MPKYENKLINYSDAKLYETNTAFLENIHGYFNRTVPHAPTIYQIQTVFFNCEEKYRNHIIFLEQHPHCKKVTSKHKIYIPKFLKTDENVDDEFENLESYDEEPNLTKYIFYF